jgi:hypothetical protein
MQNISQHLAGKFIALEVEPNDTVENVNVNICDDEGMVDSAAAAGALAAMTVEVAVDRQGAPLHGSAEARWIGESPTACIRSMAFPI